MARELAQEFRVEFVESMGLRKIEVSTRDFRRVLRRLSGSQRQSDQLRHTPVNISVIRPVALPIHTGPSASINRRLIRHLASSWISYGGPRILWTYTPVTYGLQRHSTAAYYHCVDLLGAFPGISPELINRNEAHLSRSGVQAIASSEAVRSHLHAAGFSDVKLWPNVADVSTIVDAGADHAMARTPAAVFAGNFTTHKVDFDLLNRITDSGIDLHLAGPVSEGGGDASQQMRKLVEKGANYHGLLRLEQLAQLYGRCTVGLVPYLINQYTEGVNPLKTYEYLAAGLSVISTKVPAVIERDDDVIVASNRNEFIAAVHNGLAAPNDETIARRLSIASKNSWLGRGAEARRLVHESVSKAF